MLDFKDVISVLGTGKKLAQEMLIVEKHFCYGLNETSTAPCKANTPSNSEKFRHISQYQMKLKIILR